MPWKTPFSFIVWGLWLDRNNLVFNNYSNLSDVRMNSTATATEFLNAENAIFKPVSTSMTAARWMPHLQGWIKLNSDGSVKDSERNAGVG